MTKARPRGWRKRSFLLGGLALLLALPLALWWWASSQQPAALHRPPPPALAATAAPLPGFDTVQWADLLQPGWNPMEGLDLREIAGLDDADPRARRIYQRLRERWNEAPAHAALDGRALRLLGYVVVLEEAQAGVSEFLLVPTLGACLHTPPPPASQIVHVVLAQPQPRLRHMDAVWVAGTLRVQRSDTVHGITGYRMDAVRLDKQVENWRWN